MYMCTMKVFIN